MGTPEQDARRKQNLKVQGLCASCGREQAVKGKIYCEKCLLYFRERIRHRRHEWAKVGLCSRCGKNPSLESKKICGMCVEQDLKSRRKLRLNAFDHYGGPQCNCCGETTLEFLCIDHINGSGAEHRRNDPSANAIYRWLKAHNYPKGFRVLCHNCNMSLGIYGHCPHEKSSSG